MKIQGFLFSPVFLVVVHLIGGGQALVVERGLEPNAPRRLQIRALDHPSPKDAIHLFHGTTDAKKADNIFKDGFDIGKAAFVGDFHQSPVLGAYLTDSIYAAAQFACYPSTVTVPANVKANTVHIVEFSWDGDSSVFEFTSKSDDWRKFEQYNLEFKEPKISNHDEILTKLMVSGPMEGLADVHLTPSFWQYAALGKRTTGYSSKLKPVKIHKNIVCGNVPAGKDLTDEIYATGQFSDDSSLSAVVTTLQAAV